MLSFTFMEIYHFLFVIEILFNSLINKMFVILVSNSRFQFSFPKDFYFNFGNEKCYF